jgi:hypothetical protein
MLHACFHFLYRVGHPLITLRGLTFDKSLFPDPSKYYRAIHLEKLSHECDVYVPRCYQMNVIVGCDSVTADERTGQVMTQY